MFFALTTSKHHELIICRTCSSGNFCVANCKADQENSLQSIEGRCDMNGQGCKWLQTLVLKSLDVSSMHSLNIKPWEGFHCEFCVRHKQSFSIFSILLYTTFISTHMHFSPSICQSTISLLLSHLRMFCLRSQLEGDPTINFIIGASYFINKNCLQNNC